MRKRYFLSLLLACLACQSDSGLVFTPQEYEGPQCESCPKVRVSIPLADEGKQLGRVVNRAVREEIIHWLDYDEEGQATTIPEAIEAFGAGYEALRSEFPDETIGWEATVEARTTYETPDVLTLLLEGYIFTGGAHGFTSSRYLNFNKKEAAEMDTWQLFRDLEGFEQFAESRFREVHQIPSEADINSTGFMFEDGIFELPENMGLEPEGLVLLYNPYEVASYADGPIRLVLKYEDIEPFLAIDAGMAPPPQ